VKGKAVSGDTVYFRSQDTWSSPLPVLEAVAGVTYDGSTYGSGTRATLRATGGYKYPNGSAVNIYKSNVTVRGFDVDVNKQDSGGIYIGYEASANLSNVLIDNCVVHDAGAKDNWLYGIHVGSVTGYSISNVSIINTTVYNTIHEGIAVYPGWRNATNAVDRVLIRGCTIYNTGLTSVGGGIGVLICNDSNNVTVEYCNLYNNHRGVWIRVSPPYEGSVTSAPKNMTIRYNLIHDNMIVGIDNQNSRNLTMSGAIYSNIFYGNGKKWRDDYAFDISLANDTATPASTFDIYNNTFFSMTNECSTKYVIARGLWSVASPSPIMNFKNNIVYADNYIPIYDVNGQIKHSNNLIYRSSGASDPHIFSNGINYDRAGVKIWEASARNTLPVFEGGALPSGFTGTYGIDLLPNTKYFTIKSGDAFDNGVTLGSPFNGSINGAGLAVPLNRPMGPGYDIGAYENSQISSPRIIKAVPVGNGT
jgi:hypothetical protein